MKFRNPIPRSALPVIAALLALSQTFLGQTALGRFIAAKLREKLFNLLMEGFRELFREIAASRGTAANTAVEPAPQRPSTDGPRQTNEPPRRRHRARPDPLRPPDVADRHQADEPGPDEAPVGTPQPAEAAAPPAPPHPRPAPNLPAEPHRARSPPDKNGSGTRHPQHAHFITILQQQEDGLQPVGANVRLSAPSPPLGAERGFEPLC